MANFNLLLIYSASYLAIGFSTLFWSVFAFISTPRDKIKLSFSRYLLSVGWWAFFSVFMINAPTVFWGDFWDRICFMGVVFIPSTFLHFNFTFMGIDKKYRLFIYANYLFSLFFVAINFTPYLIKGTIPKYGLNFYTDPGTFYFPFIMYFFIISLLGIYVFYRGYRQGKGKRKQQLFNLFWSSLLGYSLGGFNYNLAFNVGSAYLALIGNIGIISHIGVYAYTITKHRLLDISVVISRAVAEILTIILLGAIYLLLGWFHQTYISTNIDFIFLSWTIVYGIIVGHIYLNVRLFIQTTSDKLILRGKYDYYKELSKASLKVGEKISLKEILKVLYGVFYEIVEIQNPQILLKNDSGKYVAYDKETLSPNKNEAIGKDDPLIKELLSKRAPKINEKEHDKSIIIPCLLEDRLIAIFMLGPKMSQDQYSDEDIQLLEVLASQAAIALDHTRSYEKIKNDLEQTERQLERSQRLAALGTLTAGVTHEIRNPLTVIKMEAQKIKPEAIDPEKIEKCKELILKHSSRIELIVEKMLGLAKVKEVQKKKIDLNQVAEDVLLLFNFNNIKVEKELNLVPPIRGDIEEIERVLINIIQNATEAMPKKGALKIKTYPDKTKVRLEISDTGKGIPKENLTKIFDPFFSSRHEGTGLGLSIVYRIIREHGGNISVNSEEGKGSTFKIEFDAA